MKVARKLSVLDYGKTIAAAGYVKALTGLGVAMNILGESSIHTFFIKHKLRSK